MPDPHIEIDTRIDDPGWPDGLTPLSERAISAAIAAADIRIAGPVEVSLLLTNDAAQRDLNRNWRSKDSPTNVLSFPQCDPFEPVEGLIGDISLARETLERESVELGKSFEDHFVHLLVHGTLHLLGYDHETEEQALVMEGLETNILAGLGIADPYAAP